VGVDAALFAQGGRYLVEDEADAVPIEVRRQVAERDADGARAE
jgi:hypothetical protein